MRTLFLLILSSGLVLPQVIVERSFVIRAGTTTVDPYSGMTNVCILVFPDGKYRLERSFQPNSGGSPDVRVYLDQLPDASMKQLQATLDDPAFQEISAESRGGIVQNMDILEATVPREHRVQNFTFPNADSRRQFEKTLKPFVNWLKDVQKRKVPVAKSEKPDNCAPPRVVYRTAVRPQSKDDTDDGRH